MKLKGVKTKVTASNRSSRPLYPSHHSVMAEQAAAPTADDRSKYETLKKELTQALPKKRATDKQLVLLAPSGIQFFPDTFLARRPRLRFRYTTSKRHI